MNPPTPAGRVRFGAFEVNLRSGELRKQGVRVKLHDQPFQILALLLQHPGEIVTREELQHQLWPANTFVDFDLGLNSAVKRLREALCDSADHPRFVETVPRHGYRFIAAIENGSPAGSPDVAATAPAAGRPPAGTAPLSFLRGRYALAAAAAMLLGALALGWSGLRAPRAGEEPHQPIRSLVVLPLENLSGDPSQEYFADGMTEALTTDLGKIASLRIISRTSATHYKHTSKTLPEIARELQVEAVVEGSVARSGDRVRITTQLVDVSTDRELWAETYERDVRDVVKLQDEVARNIANAISIKLSTDEERRLQNARVVDPEAEEAYLKGRYLQNYTQEGLTRSLAYFEEAVREDPQYAPAWAALSDDYLLLGLFGFASRKVTLPQAKAAASKAVELDDTLADAHVALATANLPVDRSWEAAELEAQRAIALNPNNARAHQYYGYFLSAMGRFDQAIAEMRRARDLDPLSPMVQGALGTTLYRAGRYDEALEQLRQVPDPDADSEQRHRCLAAIYERKGMQAEAMTELLASLRFSGRERLAASVERIYRSSGYAEAKQELLRAHLEEALRRRARLGPGWSLAIVVANDYALLGRKQEALQWLDKAIRERDGKLLYVSVDDPFRPFRSDPGFQAELHKIGLPLTPGRGTPQDASPQLAIHARR